MSVFHPGEVGIPYGDANLLLDALEHLGTEPHALLIMRHGRTAFEGYWAPYGPGMIHGCQSLTKTVTGIALGAAMQEGILSLEERLIDIFPEYAPLTQGRRYWDELRVRHIATMSAGMDTQPSVVSLDWVEAFFRTEIQHKPGTAYMYNSIACSMVGACVRKRSGLGLLDYLSDRVLRPIGIDPERLGWHKHADGLENGSGGFISTVRDNALLMELYRRRGVWNDQRLLAEEWVDFALRTQNDHVGGAASYGGMIWVRETCFVADGAMGQWGMLFLKQDLVVSIQQTISSPHVDDQVRDAVYAFVNALQDEPIAWTEQQEADFGHRLNRLCIEAPAYGQNPAALRALDGRVLEITEGRARFFADDLIIFDLNYEAPVERFAFQTQNGDLLLTVTARGRTRTCPVALRGYRPVSDVPPVTNNPARTASVTASFPQADVLRLEVRWLESCRVHILTFRFDETGARITTSRIPVGGFDVPDETARALWR